MTTRSPVMRQTGGGLWSALAWLVFPLVPAAAGKPVLPNAFIASDPRVWDWSDWVVLTGPLVGYGFLAGATLDLPDEPGRRGVRGWLGRRAVWVAVGPWVGFLFWGAVYFALVYAASAIEWAYPTSGEMNMFVPCSLVGKLDGLAPRLGPDYRRVRFDRVRLALRGCDCPSPRTAAEPVLPDTRPGVGGGFGVRRFAVRHLLGAHGGLAGLLLRSENRTDPCRRRNSGLDRRLRGHRHLRRGAPPRAVPGALHGLASGPGAALALVASAG